MAYLGVTVKLIDLVIYSFWMKTSETDYSLVLRCARTYDENLSILIYRYTTLVKELFLIRIKSVR